MTAISPDRIRQIEARRDKLQASKILPGTGSLRREASTEGARRAAQRPPHAPTTILRMVPLPVPGRIL